MCCCIVIINVRTYFVLSAGIEKIEYLQHHSNEDIYNKAYGLIDQYFHEDESLEVDTVAPRTESNQFAFSENMSLPQGGFHL